MLLLFALIVGSGTMWATTVTQTGFLNVSNTSLNGDINVSYTSYQGGGTAAPAVQGTSIRLYQNSGGNTAGYIVIGVAEKYVITSITITTSAATTAGYKLSNSNPGSSTPVKDTFAESDHTCTASGTYTVNDISSQYVIFANFGTTKNQRLDISAISVTYEAASSKEDSDLEITSSSLVDLEMTTAQPNPTSTITWTTSSTGAISFVSSDPSVATVSDAGVITAVAGGGPTTITISQATDDDYKASGNKTVTVNVTDNRDAVATGIDLISSAKTIVKENTAAIAATSTKAAGFTGEITYSYESANSSIYSIADGNYTGAGVGATTVTVTATPTGGNANLYKVASQEVAVTVNGTNSISLDETSKTQAKSAGAFNITATVPTENYNGTVSAESSNESVATVAVEGTTITVTPVSVGTATITVTAGTGTYYPTTASKTCAVEFTAPVPSVTKPSSEVNVFYESFNTNDGTGGNDDNWSGPIASNDFKADNTWVTTNAKGADRCAKFGTSSAGGSAQTPDLDLEEDVVYTLTFKAAAWNGSSEKTTLSLSANNATIKNAENTSEVSSVSMTKGAWTTYTLKLTVTDASESANVTFSTSSGNNRFFLDEVKITKTVDPTASVNIPASGYATYCSEYPLDLTDAENYKAFYVSAINGTNITLTKIDNKVKGGTPFILYGKKSTTVSIPMADSNNELNSNKLVGTMEDTYVTNIDGDNTIFGMYQGEFRKINTGVIPAHKAYLPIPTANITSGSRISMVFEDETTGINDVRSEMDEVNGEVYNLNGQRVKNPGKGLYIVNGKKVIMK